jgi:hypothetical protein
MKLVMLELSEQALLSEKAGNLWHNVMVTAAHVVIRKENYIIRSMNYDKYLQPTEFDYYPVKVFAIDQEFDLAILVFTSKKKMATAKVDISGAEHFGQSVFKIGGGANEPLRLNRGEMGQIGLQTFRMSAFTVPGDSGCGVFDGDYELIGIGRAIIYQQMPNGMPYFLFNMGIGSRASLFKVWSEEREGELDFVFKDKPLPDVYEELDKEAVQPDEIWVPIP